MIDPSLISRKRPLSGLLESDDEPPKKAFRIIVGVPKLMEETDNQEDPNELLSRVLRSKKIEIKHEQALEGFFAKYTEEEIAAYDTTVINAIRKQDVDLLRKLYAGGRPMKCSNRFGESILHMACRRNFLKVVEFLIKEAHVTVRLHDDYGRTILHDAAWACEPNFELIGLILKECPDLLHIKDQRGHTPVEYARKSHWAEWNKFIKENTDLIRPSSMISRKLIK